MATYGNSSFTFYVYVAESGIYDLTYVVGKDDAQSSKVTLTIDDDLIGTNSGTSSALKF